MNTNESISREYSYKDFANALFDLKDNARLSYGQIADKCGLSDAYLVNIVNRKNLAPNNKNIKKIAKALKIEPEYFFEYRLRRLFNLLNSNREYLDLFLRDLEISQKKERPKKQEFLLGRQQKELAGLERQESKQKLPSNVIDFEEAKKALLLKHKKF